MKQDKEHLINKIFDDLEKNAMPFENHVYDVKAANQIIRDHLTNLKQDNWISVKDRLPILKDRVLLRYKKGKDVVHTEGFLTNDAEDLHSESHTKLFWELHGKGLCYYDYSWRQIQNFKAKKSKNEVTHWQPLPGPPINSNQ